MRGLRSLPEPASKKGSCLHVLSSGSPGQAQASELGGQGLRVTGMLRLLGVVSPPAPPIHGSQ